MPPAAGATDADHQLEAGAAFFDAGRYGDALEAFDRAYESRPLGELRYHQAACLDKLGLRQLAAERYEAYLAEVPGASDAEPVRAHVTELRDQAREAAREAFANGRDAFAQGHWREASIAFAQAYEHLPLPELLLNHAAALEKLGDRVRAVESYRLYLSARPDAPDAAQVAARIEALSRR
jgi:tetratricopeptide (TPR) repeat protein